MARGRYSVNISLSNALQDRSNARLKKEYDTVKNKVEDSLVSALNTAEAKGIPLTIPILRRFVYNAISIDAKWPHLAIYAAKVRALSIPKEGCSHHWKICNGERAALVRRIEQFITSEQSQDQKNK